MQSELTKISGLPKGQRELILDFLENYRHKKKMLSLGRKSRLASQYHLFTKLLNKPLKPFRETEVKELIKAIQRYENTHKPYAMHTWKEMVKNIKIWVKWVNPDDYEVVRSKCRDEFSVQDPYSDPKRKAKIEEFLITEQTFMKLLAAGNEQHKAILCIGFGCGSRSGELLGLRRKDLKFQPDGTAAVSFYESKTYPRENVLLRPDLAHYVRAWYDQSPLKDSDDFLFCTTHGEPQPMSNQVLNLILKRLAVKAGLGKWKKTKSSHGIYYSHYVGQRIYFTKFRRSAATWALKNLKSNALAGKRIWGNENTGMFKIYAGIVSEDANDAYRDAIGLTNPTATESPMQPKTCYQCHMGLAIGQTICSNCRIETDANKLIASHEQKDAEISTLKEQMKMMQTALAQISQKMGAGP